MGKLVSERPSPDDLSRFAVTGSAGDFIFREDDPGEHLYVIQEGHVEILVSTAGGERLIAALESGDFFGAASLPDGTPRKVSARGATDFRLLRFDRAAFAGIVGEQPEIAIRMLSQITRRLRRLEKSAITASAKEPESYLIHRPSGTEFPLSAARQTTVGRPDSATGFVPDIDLASFDDSRALSRRHAKIVAGDDGFYILEEMGVQNGTFVNDRQLESGVPVKIADGDSVRFGLVTTEFKQRAPGDA